MIPGVGWLKYMFRVHCMFPPKTKGCWSFRKCQEGVKVLHDFKWKKVREGWSCPGWADFVVVGRMVLAHRYCWAQGFKEQPIKNPFENPWENSRKKWDKCHAFYHRATRAFRAFSVEVYSLISLPLTRRPWRYGAEFCRVAIFVAGVAENTLMKDDEQMQSENTTFHISKAEIMIWFVYDVSWCNYVQEYELHMHTSYIIISLIVDKCCIVTVKNCQI